MAAATAALQDWYVDAARASGAQPRGAFAWRRVIDGILGSDERSRIQYDALKAVYSPQLKRKRARGANSPMVAEAGPSAQSCIAPIRAGL
jgi:hypothetical protein